LQILWWAPASSTSWRKARRPSWECG